MTLQNGRVHDGVMHECILNLVAYLTVFYNIRIALIALFSALAWIMMMMMMLMIVLVISIIKYYYYYSAELRTPH